MAWMKMTRRLLCATATLMMFAQGSPAAAQTPERPAIRVEIDAAQSGPTIDPNIFGQFAEHLGTGIYGGVWVGPDSSIPNVRGIRTDVVQAIPL